MKYTEEVVAYRAAADDCNACPVKAACTTGAHGRLIHRSFHADSLEKVQGYHATAAYRKAIGKRKRRKPCQSLASAKRGSTHTWRLAIAFW